jgi:hypothetical protein
MRISPSSTWRRRISSRSGAPAGLTARIWHSNQDKGSNIVVDRTTLGLYTWRTGRIRLRLDSERDEEEAIDVGANEWGGSGSAQSFDVRIRSRHASQGRTIPQRRTTLGPTPLDIRRRGPNQRGCRRFASQRYLLQG